MDRDTVQRHLEKALAGLERENRRLKARLDRQNAGAAAARHLLELHHNLEKAFFSARTLETLVMTLNNRLILLPEIDQACVCLRRRYLEEIPGPSGWEAIAAELAAPVQVGYLHPLDEPAFQRHLSDLTETVGRQSPGGAPGALFPLHAGQVRSYTLVPLLLRGECIGSLNVGSFWSRNFYDAAPDREILDRLGAKLALALDNLLFRRVLAVHKERLERDVGAAAMLQRSLVAPRRPAIGGLDIVTGFSPCQRLGGDFVDVFSTGRRQVACVIADAAGHGTPAALVIAMLKFSLQMGGWGRRSAAEVVTRINSRFCRILRGSDYLTLCLALLDVDSGRLDLVRAGHPYPLLAAAEGGGVREMKPDGPPVGLDREAVYRPLTHRIGPGDILLFHTDGLTDVLDTVRPGGGGERLLRDCLEQGRCPAEIAATLEGHIAGRSLGDDASFLLVSRPTAGSG